MSAPAATGAENGRAAPHVPVLLAEVIAGLADRVAVMYAGRIVELSGVRQIFRNPGHPYTRGLLNCLPRIGGGKAPLPVLQRDAAWAT